ncbi:MAG: hypothetical protein E7267_04195 [Lachnospiraceae bacterium]|nr:hypothetical protein [Lachnospiraceae bacterium]
MKRILLIMLMLSCLFVLQPYEIQAAEYKSTELKVRGFEAQTVYSSKNKLHIIELREEENEDDEFKYHYEFLDTIISKNKIIRQRTIKCNSLKWKCAGFEDDRYYVVSRDDKSSNACKTVKVYNKKAKLISSYKIRISIKNLKGSNYNIIECRKIKNKLYYTVVARDGSKYYEYYQCYDLKKKKVLFSMEYDRHNHYTKLIGNKLYVMLENEIIEYNLKGKIINTYELPEGNKYAVNADNTDEFRFFDFDVNGKYIYYCIQNGVYSCDTKGSKTFELMYDSTGDSAFWPGEKIGFNLDTFKVMKNGNFYIQLSTDGSAETSISTRYYEKLN